MIIHNVQYGILAHFYLAMNAFEYGLKYFHCKYFLLCDIKALGIFGNIHELPQSKSRRTHMTSLYSNKIINIPSFYKRTDMAHIS